MFRGIKIFFIKRKIRKELNKVVNTHNYLVGLVNFIYIRERDWKKADEMMTMFKKYMDGILNDDVGIYFDSEGMMKFRNDKAVGVIDIQVSFYKHLIDFKSYFVNNFINEKDKHRFLED